LHTAGGTRKTLSLLFRTPYAGRRLAVRLSATTVEVLDAGRIVARHERAADRYVEVLTLDHYLEVLKTKPGALPGATASRTAYTPRTSPARDFVTIR
jgi:hypothetical protein